MAAKKGKRPVVFIEHRDTKTEAQRAKIAEDMKKTLDNTVLDNAKVVAVSCGWRVTIIAQ